MKIYTEIYKLNKILDRFPDEKNVEEAMILSLIQRIETQINISTLQMQRLEKGFEDVSYASENFKPQSIEKSIPFTLYFSDIEYFINSTHKFFKLCHRLVNYINDDVLNRLKDESTEFKETCRIIRNTFEHIDEKIYTSDDILKSLSTISNDALETKYGNIYINPNTLNILYHHYDEILKYIDMKFIEPRKDWYSAIYGEQDEQLEIHWSNLFPNHPKNV